MLSSVYPDCPECRPAIWHVRARFKCRLDATAALELLLVCNSNDDRWYTWCRPQLAQNISEEVYICWFVLRASMQPRKMGVMDADLLRVMWCYHCCAFLLDSMAKHRRCWADMQGRELVMDPSSRCAMISWYGVVMIWTFNHEFQVWGPWCLSSRKRHFFVPCYPCKYHCFRSDVASLCHWNCAIGTYHFYTRCIVLFLHIQYPKFFRYLLRFSILR